MIVYRGVRPNYVESSWLSAHYGGKRIHVRTNDGALYRERDGLSPDQRNAAFAIKGRINLALFDRIGQSDKRRGSKVRPTEVRDTGADFNAHCVTFSQYLDGLEMAVNFSADRPDLYRAEDRDTIDREAKRHARHLAAPFRGFAIFTFDDDDTEPQPLGVCGPGELHNAIARLLDE